ARLNRRGGNDRGLMGVSQMIVSRRKVMGTIGVALLGLPAMVRGQITTEFKRREFDMKITRAGSQPSTKGPADWFTGTVRIDPLFQTDAPARAQGATVTFEPGARTAWHTHPLGQTLIVTSGCGRLQREGGPIEEIRPGGVRGVA